MTSIADVAKGILSEVRINTLDGVRDAFPEFYRPTRQDEQRFIANGTVVVDANVLLALYELSAVERNEALEVLETIGDRLWIPYQVGLEYQRNRLGVIRRQAAHYTRLVDLHGVRDLDRLTDALAGITVPPEVAAEVRPLLSELAQQLNAATSDYVSAAKRIRDRHVVTIEQGIDDDPVRKRLDKLYAGRIGQRPADDTIERRISEAMRRSKDQVPPGYKDDKKETDERSAGDYLLWAEVLEHAKSTVEDGKPLLLVTNDTKEDWYAKSGGPRPELVREFHTYSSNGYHQVTMGDLLRLARTYLSVDVGDTTIEKASELSRPDYFYYDDATGQKHVVDDKRYGEQARNAALDRSVTLSLLVDMLRREALAGAPGADSDAVRRRLTRALMTEAQLFAAGGWATEELGPGVRIEVRGALQDVLESVSPNFLMWSEALDSLAIDLFLEIVRSLRQFQMPRPDEDR